MLNHGGTETTVVLTKHRERALKLRRSVRARRAAASSTCVSPCPQMLLRTHGRLRAMVVTWSRVRSARRLRRSF